MTPCVACTETVRVDDTETEQVLQNDPVATRQRKSTVRFALLAGWRVLSLSLRPVRSGSKGRALSQERIRWAVALAGPFGARKRAAGLAASRDRALWKARRAAWRLSGGVGNRPAIDPRPEPRFKRAPGERARDPATDRRKLHARPTHAARARLWLAESLGLSLAEYDALGSPDAAPSAPPAPPVLEE